VRDEWRSPLEDLGFEDPIAETIRKMRRKAGRSRKKHAGCCE